jgi:hypothetical protein
VTPDNPVRQPDHEYHRWQLVHGANTGCGVLSAVRLLLGGTPSYWVCFRCFAVRMCFGHQYYNLRVHKLHGHFDRQD